MQHLKNMSYSDIQVNRQSFISSINDVPLTMEEILKHKMWKKAKLASLVGGSKFNLGSVLAVYITLLTEQK